MATLALPDPPLRDAVIALRGLQRNDAAALVEICQDPEIARWTLVPTPYGEDEARAYLARVADGLAGGRRASLAITDAGDGRLLGTAGLMAIDWDLRAADVGYMLAAPARGRGVASRAVALLAGWAFGTLGLERLEARIDVDNRASQAVAERAGFEPVAAPLVDRPECAGLPDVFFARVRDAAGG